MNSIRYPRNAYEPCDPPLSFGDIFPIAGVFTHPLLQETQKTAIRWVALMASLVTFGISLWVLALFEPGHPDMCSWLTETLAAGGGYLDRFQPGRGRVEHPAGAADDFPHPAGDPLNLVGGGAARQGIHALLPAARSWHDRRVPGA
jgi:hypothetical protein